MSKGNDLIERLERLLSDEEADFEADLIAAAETGERIDLDTRELEVPVDWLKQLLATIASLSEALAEAEKKGAEDEGALAKAIFQADYPTDKWERFARGDVVDERYRLLARAALAHLFPPRDLSRGWGAVMEKES